jgi:hypothetical protein
MGEMDKDEEARVEWTDSSKRETTPVKLTAEQLVPDPPVTMRKRDWLAYYQADLVEAIGAEYIDLDPQPPPWVLNRRSSKRPPTKERCRQDATAAPGSLRKPFPNRTDYRQRIILSEDNRSHGKWIAQPMKRSAAAGSSRTSCSTNRVPSGHSHRLRTPTLPRHIYIRRGGGGAVLSRRASALVATGIHQTDEM